MRIFFAISLPEDIRQSVLEQIDILRKTYRSVKWVKPDNLHITLQFLPNVVETDINPLVNLVDKELKSASPFEIHFDAIELFPTPYRPAVVSLRAAPNEPQAELARMIGKGILALNYEIEHRPFRSHLTLARLDRYGKKNFDFSEVIIPDTFFQVDKVDLYESRLSPKGSEYVVIHTFQLN